MFLIVALAIVVLMLLIALVSIGTYTAIGLKRSLASLLATVISAVLAGVATLVLCSPQLPVLPAATDFVIEKVMGAVSEGLVSEDIMSLITSALGVEAIDMAINSYIGMLIGPFVFVLLFVILAILSTLLASIIASFTPAMKKMHKAAHFLGGAGIGVVCGILMSILCVFPIVGVADIVESNYDDISEIEAVQPVIEAVPLGIDFEIMGAFDYIGCGPLFDLFTSTEVDGEMTDLKTEVGVIIDIAMDAIPVIENSASLGDKEIESMRGITSSLDDSPILKDIVIDAVPFVIESGLLDFDMGELVNPVVDSVVEVISTSKQDTVIDNLNTLINVLEIVIDSGIMNETDSQAILDVIGEGLASDLLVEINKNENMYPVADEITNLSIRALAATLGIPADADERYNDLMNKIADELNNTAHLEESERFELLKQNLDVIFADYGVEVTGEALDHVTDGLMSDLGGNVSGDAVKEFFMLYHAGTVADDSDDEAKAENGVEYLSDESDSEVVVNVDGTISIGGVVLKYYDVSNYMESKAMKLGKKHVFIGDAETLYSAKTAKSTILTAEDILANMGHYDSCEDAIAESKKVGEIFVMITDIIADKDIENMDGMELFNELGPVFDKMQESEIFNSESARSIFTAILQSDKVSDMLGLSVKDMTDFADKINAYAFNREHGYEEAIKAITGTVDAVTKATDKNASTEEKVEATKNMIDNVNKDNSEMISSMLTDSMIDKFGGDTENSENAANAVKNLINNMADYKESYPDDDSVAKEAEAVTKIITVATTGSSDAPLFDTDDEKGTLASDPESFIDTIVGSEVVMQTVTQSVEGCEEGSNPYGVTYSSEEEKESVADALESYYSENGGGVELADKLMNIAIIMNVEIDLDK